MTCEKEIVFGWKGQLQVSYHQDNRLGDVNHKAIADAVAALPDAFNDGAGGKKVVLKIAFPLIFGLFVVMAIVNVALVTSATSSQSDSSDDCGAMDSPGWYDCEERNMSKDDNTPMTNFVIAVILMMLWFGASASVLCLRASAVNAGFEGVQRRLGELNQQMQPLNFSMRTEVTQVRGYKAGAAPGGPNHNPGGVNQRRTRIIYRYFLIIENTAVSQPAPVAQAVLVGQVVSKAEQYIPTNNQT